MKLHPPQITSVGVLALVLAAAGTTTGIASATSEPPGSGPTGDPTAPGCAEVTGLLDTADLFLYAYFTDDGATIEAVMLLLPQQAAAATAAAPPEIADAVSTLAASVPTVLAALEGVDLTDTDAIDAALSSLPEDESTDDADTAIRDWAGTTCAWEEAIDFDELFAVVPEPPDCEILDPAVAAAAAGLDIDVTDTDGTGDINLATYWTKSCSYANGAMSLSTVSFGSVEQASQFFIDNIGDGEVIFVDLGSLPVGSLVTVRDGLLVVTVLEATIPFSVGFDAGAVTPEAAVAAAEAVLAALPTDVPMPGSSEAP